MFELKAFDAWKENRHRLDKKCLIKELFVMSNSEDISVFD